MKNLLTGVAIVAALVLSVPVGAQPTSPGGNSMGMPGPNPGGPGLTPYTTRPQAPYTAPPATMAPAPVYPSSTGESSSATPPSYPRGRHARIYHGRTGTHPDRGYSSSDNSANQLNQAELTRLQAGKLSHPSARGVRRIATAGLCTTTTAGLSNGNYWRRRTLQAITLSRMRASSLSGLSAAANAQRAAFST
jgi:hypothetical protein